MRYDFLIDTYETERIKVINAWSMFTDHDLPVRPNVTDPRGRSLLGATVGGRSFGGGGYLTVGSCRE